MTVWTSQADTSGPAAITVASIMVAEGDPPTVLGLIDPLSEFADVVAVSARFVVHIVPEGRYRLADQMAGRSPSALDRFEDVNVTVSDWGPVVEGLTTRAYCSLGELTPLGESLLLRASVDEVDLADVAPEPLVYVRGLYRGVSPLPNRPPHFR